MTINLYTGAPRETVYLTDEGKFTETHADFYKMLWGNWPLHRKFNMSARRYSWPVFPKLKQPLF